jgi:squalene cyclase
MWSARWGINYVYAVGAVFPGLAKVGYDLREPWILNITKRLMAVQQADGGFGEDYESYNVGRYVEGATTASMTAWGLLALVEAAHTINVKHFPFRLMIMSIEQPSTSLIISTKTVESFGIDQ